MDILRMRDRVLPVIGQTGKITGELGWPPQCKESLSGLSRIGKRNGGYAISLAWQTFIKARPRRKGCVMVIGQSGGTIK